MTEQLSFKEAKRLSIIKWEAHVKAGGDEWNLPLELRKLTCNCGFCERWNLDCLFCEFGKVAGYCTIDNSIYDIWQYDRTSHNAQLILNIIKSMPDE